LLKIQRKPLKENTNTVEEEISGYVFTEKYLGHNCPKIGATDIFNLLICLFVFNKNLFLFAITGLHALGDRYTQSSIDRFLTSTQTS